MKIRLTVDESQCVLCGNCYYLFERLGGNFPNEIIVDAAQIKVVGSYLDLAVKRCFLEALKVEEVEEIV